MATISMSGSDWNTALIAIGWAGDQGKYHDLQPIIDKIQKQLDEQEDVLCINPCVKCGTRTASLFNAWTVAPTLCVHCDGHAYKTDRLMEGRFCELCDIEDYAHN